MVVDIGDYSILEYTLVYFDIRGSKAKSNVYPSQLVRCTNIVTDNRLQYIIWVSFVFYRDK